MGLDVREREVTAWLESQYPVMIELLGAVVNTDSNSYDRTGVDVVIDQFRRHLIERLMEPRKRRRVAGDEGEPTLN